MGFGEFIISLLKILFSVPVLILLISLIFKDSIGELFKTFKTALERGWLRSIKYRDFQIELSTLEQFRLVEISTPKFDDYEGFEKSTYNDLPDLIKETFLTKKFNKVLNVNLSRRIFRAPLYLYVRRLSDFFDLELIVFLTDKNFIGIVEVKEFIYFMENKYPHFFSSYNNWLYEIFKKIIGQ